MNVFSSLYHLSLHSLYLRLFSKMFEETQKQNSMKLIEYQDTHTLTTRFFLYANDFRNSLLQLKYCNRGGMETFKIHAYALSFRLVSSYPMCPSSPIINIILCTSWTINKVDLKRDSTCVGFLVILLVIAVRGKCWREKKLLSPWPTKLIYLLLVFDGFLWKSLAFLTVISCRVWKYLILTWFWSSPTQMLL